MCVTSNSAGSLLSFDAPTYLPFSHTMTQLSAPPNTKNQRQTPPDPLPALLVSHRGAGVGKRVT
jgi:hypothetical protein